MSDQISILEPMFGRPYKSPRLCSLASNRTTHSYSNRRLS
jgi:hypothetical protein